MAQPRFKNEQQRQLAHKIGYFIDCAEEDKWLLNGAGWIGPDGASSCEMRLWAALEERVQQTDRHAGTKEAANPASGRPPNGADPKATASGNNTVARRAREAAPATVPALAARTVEELAIARRIVECLNKQGIITLDTLVQKSERELRRLPGIGMGSVAEIQTVLSGHGLSLSS